jgi:hypothetical protein
MMVNISDYSQGFLTKEEVLQHLKNLAHPNGKTATQNLQTLVLQIG